jgi:hypothetical protein
MANRFLADLGRTETACLEPGLFVYGANENRIELLTLDERTR